MEHGDTRLRSFRGGIISLVRLLRDYDRAIEYDLMTRTGRTLSEILEMGAAGKVALISFLRYLPADSALYKEQNPKEEISEWYSTAKTNVILADLFDIFASAHTKKGRKAATYPRPKKHQAIGKGAIPIRDFWKWWNKEE